MTPWQTPSARAPQNGRQVTAGGLGGVFVTGVADAVVLPFRRSAQ